MEMDREKIGEDRDQKDISSKKPGAKFNAISYRLKCVKTANGLSHFIMYGDAPKKKSLL